MHALPKVLDLNDSTCLSLKTKLSKAIIDRNHQMVDYYTQRKLKESLYLLINMKLVLYFF